MSSDDNKNLVRKAQDILKKYGYDVKSTHLHELFSQLSGVSNRHVAKSKDIDYIYSFKNNNQMETIDSFKAIGKTGATLGERDSKISKTFTSSIESLNMAFNGFSSGSLVSVGGATNQGKTRFCIGAFGIPAIKSGKKVLHIVASEHERYPVNNIYINSRTFSHNLDKFNEVSNLNIIQVDHGDADKLLDLCLERKRTFHYDILIIDSLSSFKTTAGNELKNKIRKFAIENNVLVVCTEQLRRDAYSELKENWSNAKTFAKSEFNNYNLIIKTKDNKMKVWASLNTGKSTIEKIVDLNCNFSICSFKEKSDE